MVEVTIIIEGGVINTDTTDVLTVDNSQALRQSLNRIFSELINEEVSIIVQEAGGYKSAAKLFANNANRNVFLYVDLDDEKTNTAAWFKKLEARNPQNSIVISDEKKQNVFFMIQEMEAWMLKQPLAIESWGQTNGYERLYPNETIAKHSLIAGKDIESISKPSEKLKILIRHFFRNNYNGKKKKIQYGKLKSAPGLLDHIEAIKLLMADEELQRFCRIVQEGNQVKA